MTPDEAREVRALCQLVQTGRAERHLSCHHPRCLEAHLRSEDSCCLWAPNLDDQMATVIALTRQT